MSTDDSYLMGDDSSPLDNLEPAPATPDPEEMLQLLTSLEPSQRMLAARAFCEIKDSRAVPQLVRLLTDVCPLIRVSAAYALGRNPSPVAVEPLIAQLVEDWSGYVRKGIVWALGNSRDDRALVPLVNALATDISAVRLWAASSLAQMANAAVLPALLTSLKGDPVAAVRSNCAWAVGQLCRELPTPAAYTEAIAALINALEADPDMGVQADAQAALLKVGDPRGLQVIERMQAEGIL